MSVRLDDLCVNGYKIYQDDSGFRFGTDAVLLAWFAGMKKFRRAADLCAGNGVISVLLTAHTCCEEAVGYELSPEAHRLSAMTAVHNNLTDKLTFFCRDIRTISREKGDNGAYFDLVTANPPYMTEGSGAVSESLGGARTELNCTLDDVVSAAAFLLKNGGRFCMVHKPDRVADAMCAMREKKLEPKRLLLVSPSCGKKPELMLIEGIKQGKPGVFCEPTLEIYGKDGQYTPIMNRIYGRNDG